MNPIVKITMVRIIGQNSVTMAQMRNATTAKKSDYTLYTYFSHNPMRRQCQFTVKRPAVSPKCAVRDGVELLVLAAGDPVANVASKGRAKDAKYRHEGNRNNGERKSGMGIVDHRDNEKGYGNPHSCTGNTASDNTSNHLNDLHNLMRTHCQFTVKRPEKRVGLTVAAEQQPKR